jgi:hypothetical protein
MLKWLRNRKALRARKRINRCKGVYTALTFKARDELRDCIRIQAYSGFFRDQALVDMCKAAVEVLEEEEEQVGKILH